MYAKVWSEKWAIKVRISSRHGCVDPVPDSLFLLYDFSEL